MTVDSIAKLGTILGVWAHPDDEAYLSAGVMAIAAAQGQQVVCVTATKGELGFPDDDPRPPSERATIRIAELAECLAVLGVSDHRWLDYADGGCDAVDDSQPVGELTEIIAEVRPDTLLTFGPDGMTGHHDHQAVSRWTTRARAAARPDAGLLYATKTRDWTERYLAHSGADTVIMDDDVELPAVEPEELALLLELKGDMSDRKQRALRAQASQLDPFIAMVGMDAFCELVGEEFFRAPKSGDWD